MLQFMDHCEDRDMDWTDEIVRVIREEWGQAQYSEQLVRRVVGILDINCVERRVVDGPSGVMFLPITSLATHTCTSNSIKVNSVNPQTSILFRWFYHFL